MQTKNHIKNQVEAEIKIQKNPQRIIAIANQKGGVGKTTTAINLATSMAAVGARVLIIDLDPQGNASTGLGIQNDQRQVGSYDVLINQTPMAGCILPTIIPGVQIVPATMDLSAAELELVQLENREFCLQTALTKLNQAEMAAFDYVFIDCPPALGLLTLNALIASDAVLVPLQCEFYALEGLSHLMRTIQRVKRAFNPKLEIQGVVLTMYDKRNRLSGMVEADVREHLGDKVYHTVIPRNVRVSEAPSHGKPVLVYDLHCQGSKAYLDLAKEMIKREGFTPTPPVKAPSMSQGAAA